MRVHRTRNAGTWTESQYFGRIRGALRKTFAAWIPMKQAMLAARRPAQRPDRPLLKFEYQCAICREWFPLKDAGQDGDKLVHCDHKLRAGSLRSLDDIKGWIERLTSENPDDYQCVCIPCHQDKSNKERGL